MGSTRVVVYLSRKRKIALHFGALLIHDDHPHASPVRLILRDRGGTEVGFELLKSLEVGFLMHRRHDELSSPRHLPQSLTKVAEDEIRSTRRPLVGKPVIGDVSAL